MSAIQPSKLLPSLFSQFDPSERLTVLHIGPALPETVEFFSRFRCKLFFVDLLSELPIAVDDDSDPSLTEKFSDLLDFPLDSSLTQFMSEHYGIIECRTRVSMRPTAMPESQAQALGVAVGMPSLCISREIRDQHDRIIEFDQEYWRRDALDIIVDLQQPHSGQIGGTHHE